MRKYILPAILATACVVMARIIYGANAMINDTQAQLDNLIDMVEAGEDIIILRTTEDDVPDPKLTLEGYLHGQRL